MALLRLAHNFHGSDGIVALTVDHALRKSSATEARQVKSWCKAIGIEHHTLKWQHVKIASGLQAKARAARYDLMTTWCIKQGIANLLTAHTADDQAETVCMRMKRTSSPASLAGIWPEAEWGRIHILRPLLMKRRATLRAYLRLCGQPWIEDPSNHDEKFERVRTRNSKPDINLAKLATLAQTQVIAAKRQAKMWTAKNCVLSPSGMLQFSSASLASLSISAHDEALQTIIARCGGTQTELAKRQDLSLWIIGSGSSRRTLGRVVFAKTKDGICAAKEAARIDASPQVITSTAPLVWDGRFSVTAPKGSTVTAKYYVKHMKRNDKLPFFVDQSLPVVRLANHVFIDAVQSQSAFVTATFIKK